MAVYKVYFKASVEKDLKPTPQEGPNQNFPEHTSLLCQEPQPFGSAKLSDQDRYLNSPGKLRGWLYSIQDDELTVCVVKVGNRKDIYRRRKE